MHSLEDLLHTLATCQQALDPSIAARHSRRIRWIEDLLYAVVRDDPAAGRSRGGDPAQYPLQILSRIVFDHTTDLISVVAADGCYVYPNPAHLTVLGYGPSYLFGRSVFELVHPDERSYAEDSWRRLKEEGHGRITLRYRHARGHYQRLEVQGVLATTRASGHVVLVSRAADVARPRPGEERASESRWNPLGDPDAGATPWSDIRARELVPEP